MRTYLKFKLPNPGYISFHLIDILLIWVKTFCVLRIKYPHSKLLWKTKVCSINFFHGLIKKSISPFRWEMYFWNVFYHLIFYSWSQEFFRWKLKSGRRRRQVLSAARCLIRILKICCKNVNMVNEQVRNKFPN